MKKIQKGATKRIAYGGAVLVFVFVIAALAASNFYSGDSQQAATKVGTERSLCMPSASVRCGRIVITKDTVPNNDQDFSFTHNVSGYASPVTLDDDGILGNPLNNNYALITPYNGTFSISETYDPNFETSVTCTDPSGGTMFGNNSAVIGITNGETVTCTFTNKKVYGQVPVDPVSVPKPDPIGTGLSSNDVPSLSVKVCPDAWTQKENFAGGSRNSAVGFSIGNKGYIGTGYDANGVIYKDLWQYDPDTDTWAQQADLPGVARYQAVGFSIGTTKGYIGTGNTGSGYLKDFWQYNSGTNTWEQKPDFGGVARADAVGFSIGITKGYIGGGSNDPYVYPPYQDFWEYNPATESWTQKAPFGGGPRQDAVGFSIGFKGYMGTGYNFTVSPYTSYQDFWEFDPTANSGYGAWTQKANFGGGSRRDATGFSIGTTKGFIGTGFNDTNSYQDFWEFDPTANSGYGAWTQKANFGGGQTGDAVGFSINGRGYMGTGHPVYGNTSSQSFYEYCP